MKRLGPAFIPVVFSPGSDRGGVSTTWAAAHRCQVACPRRIHSHSTRPGSGPGHEAAKNRRPARSEPGCRPARGADLTFGPSPAANSGSECRIQKLHEDLYLLVV